MIQGRQAPPPPRVMVCPPVDVGGGCGVPPIPGHPAAFPKWPCLSTHIISSYLESGPVSECAKAA